MKKVLFTVALLLWVHVLHLHRLVLLKKLNL